MADLFAQLVEKETGQAVETEYRFAPPRRWRFDYAVPKYKVAIEIEGGAHTQGRHTRGAGFINDMEKYNMAIELGWTLLRYTPGQKLKYSTIEQVRTVLRNKKNEALCKL
jgi:very-short-patch-repair endonuclease